MKKRDSNRKQAKRVAKVLSRVINELRQAVGEKTAVVSFEATVAVPRRESPARRGPAERALHGRPNVRPVHINRLCPRQ